MTIGRPPLYTENEQIIPLVDAYFKACDDKKEVITNDKGQMKIILEPYTVSGLCMALNMTRETLNQYEDNEVFSDTIKAAKQRIENWIETKALVGAINPVVSIFNLKNNFGWKDKTETELSNKEGESFKISGNALNEEQLNARIAELSKK